MPAGNQPPGQRAERVRFIADLMVRNAWSGRPWQQKELSELWNVSRGTVRHYSAEAHNLLAIDPKDRAALRLQLANRMLSLADAAATMKSQVTGLPDFASAIKATREYAEFTSALDTTGTENGATPRVEVVLLEKSKP